MGTKIHCKSYFPGFYSMRDLNENSSSSNWPVFYGDKMVANGQYYNGFMPRASVDGYSGHDKDTLKQKMLEHEAVFKNQVCELHRLYRIQRDMMEEAKRRELHQHRASMEPASSSSHQGSQEDAQKWHMAGFPLLKSSFRNFSSPVSCTQEIATQPGQSPFQNGSTSKDSEALDLRPFKVRKKLFDLQLPADQYVDDPEEEENMLDHKESDLSSCTPNGNPSSGPESSMKLVFLGSHVDIKSDRPMDASASTSRLRGSTGLADLNEPIQIEEATGPSSVDFLGRASENVETRDVHQPPKSTAGYLGVTRDTTLGRDGFSIISSSESQANDRGWFSHINKAGSSRGNLSSVTQGCHSGKGTYPSGNSREDLWREGFRHGLESSGKTYDHSNSSHLEPIASQNPASYPFFSSSSFASAWVHPVSSWAKPTNSFTQNISAMETSAKPAAMSRTSQPSALSQEYLGGKWADSSSRLNPVYGNESKLNGFYHASASGSKEVPAQSLSAHFDYLNCSRGGGNVASERSANHGFGSFPKSSYHADSKPVIDINLNEALPKSLSNEISIMQDLSTADGKCKPEDNLQTLPWLKGRSVYVDEVSNTSRSELSRELSSFHASSNHDSEVPKKKEAAQAQTVQKILGVPIFERDVPENELSSHASTSMNVDCHERRNRMIDINVACEPDEQIAGEELTVENEKQKKAIDLNSCVSDCEDPPSSCYERKSACVNITLELDLEVPVFMESDDDNTLPKENIPEENKHEQIQDEVLKKAAETILAISTCPQIGEDDSVSLPSEASMTESLLWFVQAVSSYENDISEEMDDFEAMTLQLPETREEDYMPKPFIPEIQKVEETGSNALTSRSRRGHSRRGRQRRDFQRDILPGLTSLSRHEVTEDLQTFGGLMRATGHSWNSGFNRRNGGGRGRRRAVAETIPTAIPSPVCPPLVNQLGTIEAGLEDRSLTGWGKTTRRPRRQRCPAGNLPTVALT